MRSGALASALTAVQQSDELFPGHLVRAKGTEHSTGGDPRVLFLHAAHAHAQVLGSDNHADPIRVQFFHERVGNLGSEPLLHLQAARIDLDQAGDLESMSLTRIIPW